MLDQNILGEVRRLENSVNRLRDMLEDDTNDDDTRRTSSARHRLPANRRPRRQTPGQRPTDDELQQMLNDAPVNKNGSIDLRTEEGRLLRAFGMVDELGYPADIQNTDEDDVDEQEDDEAPRSSKRTSRKSGRRS